MSHLFAASGCVFVSASEALEKYLNDFETTTGIDLVQRSHRDCSTVPQPAVKPNELSTTLVDRIAACSETAMVPYMIQKIAQRAVTVGNATDADLVTDDEDDNDDYFTCEKTTTEHFYVCPNQPVTTYDSDTSAAFESRDDETYGSLYADLRRIREQISNRYWTRTPPGHRQALAEHFETCKLIEELKMISDSEDDDTEQHSLDGEVLSQDPNTARLSLSVNKGTSPESLVFTHSEVTNTSAGSPLNASSSIISHDSGLNSPPLPPSGRRVSPTWAVPWDESEILKSRQRHDTSGSSMSLASSTSRISEPKILSSSEKERIRSRLCELDSLPRPLLISAAFR